MMISGPYGPPAPSPDPPGRSTKTTRRGLVGGAQRRSQTKIARRSLAGGAKRRSQTKITRRSLVGGAKRRSPQRARAALGAAQQTSALRASIICLASLDLFYASHLRCSAALRVGFASAFENCYCNITNEKESAQCALS